MKLSWPTRRGSSRAIRRLSTCKNRMCQRLYRLACRNLPYAAQVRVVGALTPLPFSRAGNQAGYPRNRSGAPCSSTSSGGFFSPIPTLLGVFTLIFILTYLMPGDPVRAVMGETYRRAEPETIERIRDQLGLNDPWFVQYGRFLLKRRARRPGSKLRPRRIGQQHHPLPLSRVPCS